MWRRDRLPGASKAPQLPLQAGYKVEGEQTPLRHLTLGPVSGWEQPGGGTLHLAGGKVTSLSAVCEISTGEQVEAFSTIVRSNQIMQHVDNYGKPQMQNLT